MCNLDSLKNVTGMLSIGNKLQLSYSVQKGTTSAPELIGPASYDVTELASRHMESENHIDYQAPKLDGELKR